MIKEYLEAFHKIMETYGNTNSLEGTYIDFLTIKQALQRLEAMDNAKPSEAIECLLDIKSNYKFYAHNNRVIDYQCSVITQALLKADLDKRIAEEYDEIIKKQEKVREIIKNKCLYEDNLLYVAFCTNYNMYKEKMSEKYDTKVVKINWDDKVLLDYIKLLTQEEFDLLKRYFNVSSK